MMRLHSVGALALALCAVALLGGAAAQAPSAGWCEGEGWELLPELEPGLPDIPGDVVNATERAFETAFAEGDDVEGPTWTPCSDADFVVQGDGCSQTLDDGTIQYWLTFNLTCNDDSTDFAQVEALVNATADGDLSVEILSASLSNDEQPPLTVGQGSQLLLGGSGFGGDPTDDGTDGGSADNIGGQTWNDQTEPNDGPPAPADVTYLDCGQGQYAASNGWYCAQCPTGCQNCVDTGAPSPFCYECSSGFLGNGAGACVKNGINPVKTCARGQYLDPTSNNCNKCNRKGCPTCAPCGFGARGCQNNQFCTSCANGYLYRAGGCTACSQLVGNCAECRTCSRGRACSKGAICIKCARGFALSRDGSNRCVRSRCDGRLGCRGL